MRLTICTVDVNHYNVVVVPIPSVKVKVLKEVSLKMIKVMKATKLLKMMMMVKLIKLIKLTNMMKLLEKIDNTRWS